LAQATMRPGRRLDVLSQHCLASAAMASDAPKQQAAAVATAAAKAKEAPMAGSEAPSSREAPSGSATGDAKQLAMLQPMLERAMRETLREMAQAAGDQQAGAAQSLESIVRNVSTRIVQEQAGAASAASAAVGSKEASPKAAGNVPPPPEPIQPMLSDLAATPWELWREPASPVRGYTGGLRGFGCQCRPRRALRGGMPDTPSRSPPNELESQMQMPFSPFSPFSPVSAGGVLSPATGGYPSPGLGSPAPSVGHGWSKVFRAGLTTGFHSAQHTMMQWQQGEQDKHGPRNVLLVAKPRDRVVFETLQDMAAWLSSQGVVTVLEPEILEDQPKLWTNLPNVRTFSSADELEQRIDLVITIGGDGTLTWATSRFPGAMPPVLSFAAGSLGFLTPFPLDGWVRTLTRLFHPSLDQPRLPLVCRLRLHVSIHRRGSKGRSKEDGIHLQCLNEVLMHRGPAGSLCKFDLSVDGDKVTVVQGDGIIVATPTGSTAYSLSAGGSMVHPGVPGMLVTPVSPHSLSFRPAVLPDSAEVCLTVPLTARHGASVTVDGKDVCLLETGDSVHVSMSPHPVPTMCSVTETSDWFASVHSGLQWNNRLDQKP